MNANTSFSLNLGNILNSGEILDARTILQSSNGCFVMLLLADGNLVLYDVVHAEELWSTQTVNSDTKLAIMQGDGNFVLYTASGSPTWASNTFVEQSGAGNLNTFI